MLVIAVSQRYDRRELMRFRNGGGGLQETFSGREGELLDRSINSSRLDGNRTGPRRPSLFALIVEAQAKDRMRPTEYHWLSAW